MSELKCCPFCGAKLELVREHYWCHPTDEKCILRHLCFEADDLEGVELWNTRKPMERIVERLEEMKMRYFLTITNTGNKKLDSVYEEVGNCIDRAIEIVKEEGLK